MRLILRIAWRNLFRNRRRSLIVAMTVAVGLWGSLLSIWIMRGMVKSSIYNTLDMHTSNINIHMHGFQETHDVHLMMNLDMKKLEKLMGLDRVTGYAPRVLSSGLANTAESSSGVEIVGIDRALEPKVTDIKDSLVAGAYLKNPEKNEIVIGKLLAEKLGASLGKKIVLMAQAVDQTIGSGAYRIVGLYETISPDFDKTMVFISIKNAQKLLAMNNKIHAIAVRLSDDKFGDTVQETLKNFFPEPTYEVLNWREIFPLLDLQLKFFTETQYLFFLVMVIAMSFTIINTLLMVIFERIHEFGVIRAIGLKSYQLMLLIMLESICLALTGIIFGTAMSIISLLYLHKAGLDISRFSDAVKSVGMSSVIYPEYDYASFLICTVGIFVVAMISSIYPGLKAARLQPVEAIRYR